MPPDLVTAHKDLDEVVLKTYGLEPAASDAKILEELLRRYAERTLGLFDRVSEKKRTRRLK